MGTMASAAANDFAIGVGLKDDPYNPTPRDDMSGRISPYEARTRATVKREKARNAASGESTSPAQAAAAQLAEANRNIAIQGRARDIAPVGAAPTIPDPNAIGETEQALLDAQKKGRSSTIATSSRGLLSGEDDTRKKRSLMGGLIS